MSLVLSSPTTGRTQGAAIGACCVIEEECAVCVNVWVFSPRTSVGKSFVIAHAVTFVSLRLVVCGKRLSVV